jgi:acylphosphatase
MITISITVSGKVQGVWYRQAAKEQAQQLGITGQVRNQPGGSVHIIATGTKEQLDELRSWCSKGPPRAIVENIEVKELPLHSFERFSIER